MEQWTMPSIDWTTLMPTIIVILTGCAALIVEMLRPKQNNNLIVGVSLVGLGGAAYCLLSHLGLPEISTLNGLVERDRLGSIIQLVLVGVTALTILFSEPYLRNKRIAFGEFYPLALWSAAGGMVMASSENLLMIFIGLELLSIGLYCMAGLSREETKSEESALKYFLLGAFASAFLLYGIAMFFGATGSISLSAAAGAPEGAQGLLTLSSMMLIVGLGFKLALVPFHQWTPDVYQGAPTNVTAFMAAASKAAAAAAAIRIFSAFVPVQDFWMPILYWMAILSMAVGSFSALVQKDVKRVLGYSSIANAGYILVAILGAIKSGDGNFAAAIYYLVVYSAATVGAFAVISVTAKAGTEGTRFEDLHGMWKKAPLAAGTLVFFMASMIGIPPLAGFFGKLLIFQTAVNGGYVDLAIVLAATSVASAFYYLRIMHAAFAADETAIPTQAAPVRGGLKASLIICAASTLILAFGANKIITAIEGEPEPAVTVALTGE
jgi:NADH-quinone oxidoreductase subunit N